MKLSDLQPDAGNANRGTERGRYMLERSLEKLGAGRSILLDKHGRIIAGNKTAEVAEAIGLDDVIVVQTDGRQLVAVQRTDLDLDTPEGREMAYADNRVGQVDLSFDPDVIKADLEAGMDLGDWFREWMPPEAGEWGQAFGGLPDSDRAPFQQMTFTLHDSQKTIVDEAIRAAKAAGDFSDSPNQNSNGNALAYICEVFANGQG